MGILKYTMKTFKKLLKFIKWVVLMGVAIIVITNAVVYFVSLLYIYKDATKAPKQQTALILGAGIHVDGTLSPIFQSRVDEAIELYKAKKVGKILASGDNSTVSHNEVNSVRTYLLGKGIPDGDIFLDHAGFDTYSTM